MNYRWWTERIFFIIIIVVIVNYFSDKFIKEKFPFMKIEVVDLAVQGIIATLILDYIYM